MPFKTISCFYDKTTGYMIQAAKIKRYNYEELSSDTNL